MTEFLEHFSPLTRFEMALLERLQRFEVVQAEILDQAPRDGSEFDTDRIHAIGKYLIDEEELGAEFDSSERDNILNIGMFIYGFMDWGMKLGSEADRG